MDRVLGLDLALARTGWACLRGREWPRVHAWGHVSYDLKSAKGRADLPAKGVRLDFFWERVNNLIAELRPDVVAVEDYTLAQARLNPRTLADLAELGGVVRLAAVVRGVPYTLWGPSEWKIHLFGEGNGGRKKEEVAQLVEEWYEINTDGLDHNQMEGFCVAMAEWENRHGNPRRERKKR